MSDASAMISAQGLTKTFGKFVAVDSIDLEIPRGQVVGFLGPNGAGKTTTIRMIAGFLPPTAGRITVDNLDVHKQWRQVRQRIGYLPESAPSYSEMKVGEYLKFRAKLFGIERGKRKRAIDLAVRRCWLDEVRRRPIHQLSKGFRQRVGLAAALIHQPPVLILDEPTVGLDPAQIREVRSLIRELAGNHTILLSTHILPEVELTCDHVLMIARGRIRASGAISDLNARVSRNGVYRVETDSVKAAQALRDVRGVRDVQALSTTDVKWRRLLVSAEEGSDDLRETIAQTLAKLGGVTREITRDAPSLEQLFLNVIEAEELSSKPRVNDAEIAT